MTTELSPEEWSALKRSWADLEQLPEHDRRRGLDSTPLSPAGRRLLGELLSIDEDTAPQIDRPAHELLGLAMARDASEDGPSMVGRRLGAYRVLRLVGRGGMGAVYEAERADDVFRQRVAIKTVWRGADSTVLLQRFRSERQILAALQHPNIAQLLDGGSSEEGTPWLAMEFVEGTPIDQWCDERSLSLAARLDLFRQVCAAVSHAHQRLVVHRDLKPSNILVNADGTVKLLDFGVAKLLAPTDVAGTLTGAGLSPFTAGYAAPEQIDDHAVSTAMDVYALGGVLTLLLAGAPPRDITHLSAQERLLAVREGRQRSPSVIASTHGAAEGEAVAKARGFPTPARLAAALRGELDAIAGRALRFEPSRRYASAEALSDDVHRYLRRDRVLARPDSTAYRLWAFARRRRALTITALAVFLVVSAASAVALVQARAARAEARRAERATAFLSGLVTGSNATSYDPLVRLAPNGTLAQLLDSALVRIPREFPDDARIRARLYTAIGANLVTQGRAERALVVLDSAQRLAAAGYGQSSVEYARARLEHSAQRLSVEGPESIAGALREAQAVVDAHPEDRELSGRLLLLRASQAMQLGHVIEADSLASRVLDGERGRPRSMLSLRAEAMRMYASSWISLDPRNYLRRARAVSALADSLGLVGTNEQYSALNAQFEALAVLGRAAQADSALHRMQAITPDTTSASTAVMVAIALQRAALAGIMHDTATQHAAIDDGLRRSAHAPSINAETKLQLLGAYVSAALARHDTAGAVTVARTLGGQLQATGSPLILSFVAWYLGQAELAAGHPDAALAAVAQGQRWIARAPDLHSVGPLLRRVQIGALTALGRTAEVDSIRASVPKRGAIAPCTPGGDWRGCPDGGQE